MKHVRNSWFAAGWCFLALGAPAWLPAAEKLNATATATAAVREPDRISGQMESLSAAVGPKVVQIVTQSIKVAGAGEQTPAGVLVAEHGRGSGFFVEAGGYILTNAHVIANATRITVTVQSAGGPSQSGPAREYPGLVVGVDGDNDLAVLKIEAEGVPFFDLSRGRAARQGELVLAFGSPMGLSQSASLGLVSATDRQLSLDDPRTYIQTDASMNPGNSGGPLVDLEGSLLGIDTMILSQSGGSEGLGFAVPLDAIRRSYSSLKEKGMVARARLGIQPRSLTADLIAGLGLKVQRGVLVEDVDPYGPGAAAGLIPGDVMVAVNRETVHDIRDLYRAESGLSAGTAVDLWVKRGDGTRVLRITPEAMRQAAPASPAAGVTEKENLVLRLGLYGATLTPAMVRIIGGLRSEQGVLVVALAGLSLTGQNAMEPDDVIHQVNGCVVDGMESLRRVLETIADGAPMVLQIERGGMLSYMTPGDLPNREQRLRKARVAPESGRGAESSLQY